MTTQPHRDSRLRCWHAVMATLMLGLLVSGLVMIRLDDRLAGKWWLFDTHEALGLLLPLLLLWRWVLRKASRPVLPGPGWMRVAAGLNQGLLYLLVLALPVSGYLQAAPYGVELFDLPLPAPQGRFILAGYGFKTHVLLSKLLIVLLIFHLAGAAWHAARTS